MAGAVKGIPLSISSFFVCPSLLALRHPLLINTSRQEGAWQGPVCSGVEQMAWGDRGSGPRPGRSAVVRLVRGCESWAADTAEGAIGVDTACVDTERGGRLSLITFIDVCRRRYGEHCSGLGTL